MIDQNQEGDIPPDEHQPNSREGGTPDRASGFGFHDLTGPDGPSNEELHNLAARFNGARTLAAGTEPHTVTDILRVRNSLKLASKLTRDYVSLGGDVDPVSKTEPDHPGAMQPSYNAFIAVMAGLSIEETISLTLLPAYRQAEALGSEEWFAQGVERKFGADVKSNLIAHADGTSALLMPSLDMYTDKVEQALEYIHEKLAGRARRWGPDEQIPVAHHAAETGLILALTGAKWPIIECGLLHDFIEDRPDGMSAGEARAELSSRFGHFTAAVINALSEDRNALSFETDIEENDVSQTERNLFSVFVNQLRRQIPDVADQAQEIFEELVDSPQHQKWLARKCLVKTQLLLLNELDPEVALAAAKVCCAAKVSTMSAGNKYLWSTAGQEPLEEAIAGWSTGSYQLNRAHWNMLEILYTHIGVDGPLLEQFLLERSRFDSFASS